MYYFKPPNKGGFFIYNKACLAAKHNNYLHLMLVQGMLISILE